MLSRGLGLKAHMLFPALCTQLSEEGAPGILL